MAILQKPTVPVDVVLSEIDIPGSDERLWVRAMGSLSAARIEDTARSHARAHGPQCG